MTIDVKNLQQEIRRPVLILLCGFGLGFLADRLFGTAGPVGLGFALWSLVFAGAFVTLYNHLHGGTDWQTLLAWPLIGVCAAGLLLIRTTPILVLGLLFTMVIAMTMTLFVHDGNSFRESSLGNLLKSLLRLPVQALCGGLVVVGNIDFKAGYNNPRFWSALKGALLALPLLLVFVALFSSADAAFDRLVGDLFSLFSTRFVQHLVLTLLFGWFCTGLLAAIAGQGRTGDISTGNGPSLIRLGTEDTAVLMGSLCLLFLVFIVLQLGYLFGGQATIEATSGLTLADYARRGFFELLAVAGLTLVILILVSGSGCNPRVFRPLAVVLIICVLIMQVSAIQRLLLYILAFGLTIDRLIACAVMAWLVSGILLFSTTLLRGRVRDFAAGLTLSGLVVVLALVLFNPAAVVTRFNIGRADTHYHVLDTGYLLDLGTDAVPALIEHFPRLPTPQRCTPVTALYAAWFHRPGGYTGETRDWRGWNFSRHRANVMIDDFEEQLQQLGSACLVNGRFLDSSGSEFTGMTYYRYEITDWQLITWLDSTSAP